MVLPLSHWRNVSMQSTPAVAMMTHAKLLLANTGFAARSTSVLAIHAEKTYKEVKVEDGTLLIIYCLSSVPMPELQWLSNKNI